MNVTPTTSVSGEQLHGKVIVITGGAKGLGAAISKHAAAAGAEVVVVGRDVAKLREHSKALGSAAIWIDADLSQSAAPASIIDQVMDRKGRLDGLVNNAGSAHFAPIAYTSIEDFDRILALDVRAPLLLAGAASKVMSDGGSIVNISSAMSAIGQPATALYAAAKGGLDAATRALAAELGRSKIRVNGVRPGLTRTEATEYAYSDGAVLEQYHRTVPLGRTGTADEVAETVTFLLSDKASFITGQTIAVDGGHTTSNLAVFGPDIA